MGCIGRACFYWHIILHNYTIKNCAHMSVCTGSYFITLRWTLDNFLFRTFWPWLPIIWERFLFLLFIGSVPGQKYSHVAINILKWWRQCPCSTLVYKDSCFLKSSPTQRLQSPWATWRHTTCEFLTTFP